MIQQFKKWFRFWQITRGHERKLSMTEMDIQKRANRTSRIEKDQK